jgi:hypothetical protein
MDFDQTWYILSPGTLLIFKIKDQGHWVKFLGEGKRRTLHCPCSHFNFCCKINQPNGTKLHRGFPLGRGDSDLYNEVDP